MSKPAFSPPLKREPGEPVAIPGMAHFAGTGPLGKDCGSCTYFEVKNRPKNPKLAAACVCRKWCALMDRKVKEAPSIHPWFNACKYYEARLK
jgi:hypothetical protein